MDSYISGKVEWKVLIWLLGAILAFFYALSFVSAFKNFNARVRSLTERMLAHLDRGQRIYFVLFSLLFLGNFCYAKWTQLITNEMHSQDFWLFVDLLDQSARGGFNLTRFAPQASGWVQHGAVHAFLPLFLLIPLAWWIPAKWILLFLNPVALVAAGAIIFRLAKKVWRPSLALMLMLSFLLSSYVGKILMYETHPESLYPLLLLGWAWAIKLAGTSSNNSEALGRLRKIAIYLSVLLLMTLKEDTIFIFLPFVFLAVLSLRKEQQEAALASLVLGIIGYAFQLFALNQWARGNWGPEFWDNAAVTLPLAAGAQGSDQSWASFPKIFAMITQLWEKSGGLSQVPWELLKFLVSRPFLTLLIGLPWIGLRFSFWICILPISLLYCLNPSPAKLWNYYSAPFLSVFWLSAILAGQTLSSKFKEKAPFWALLATCIFGAGGSIWFIPSAAVIETKTQVAARFSCLETALKISKNSKTAASEKGFIGAGLIFALSDQQRQFLLYDRVPSEAALKNISFALFDPSLERFENSRESLEKAAQQFSASSEWGELDANCKWVLNSPENNPSGIRLFLRKSH